MITKITVLNSRSICYEQDPKNNEATILGNMVLSLADESVWFEKALACVNRISEFPEDPIVNSLDEFFRGKYEVRNKTKSRRVYFVWGGLYIHEEDQN